LQLQQAAAIKHKTAHARRAQLLQPSLAFCFNKDKGLRAATVMQVLHSLFYFLLQLLVVAATILSFIVSFIASFIVVVIPSLKL